MSDAFVLAHLSDIHLGPMPAFWPRHWNVKRLLGFVNWHRRRRFVHRIDTLARLTADLAGQDAAHIAVTGDLTNIGLPSEHIAALRWLETLGPPSGVSVIPGNHDIYTRLRRDPGVRRWQAFMTSDEEHLAAGAGLGFPFVRRFGRIALVGVNSAVETAVGRATGRVGGPQRERLGIILKDLGAAGLVRVVLIHHPPLPGQARPSRALLDAADVERVLVEAGAELVLHGHNHRNMLEWRTTAAGRPFPVVGVPSASFAHSQGSDMMARYNLYRIAPTNDAPPEIEIIGRGVRTWDGAIEELARAPLVPPAGLSAASPRPEDT